MISYSNNRYTITLDRQNIAIESFVIDGKEYIGSTLPLFTIALRDGKNKPVYVSANNGEASGGNNKYIITYSHFKEADLTVRVIVNFRESGIDWNIEVDNNTEYYIEWIDFPQIAVPNDLNGGDNKILWGFNEGVVVNDIAFRQRAFFPYLEPAYPSRGLMGIFPAIVETQFMAYYNGEGGLYFGAHDRDGNIKGIDFYPVENGIKMQFRLFTGTEKGGGYVQPYTMVMELFKGDWHNAADIYRDWFEVSSDFTHIENNPAIPDWYGKSPVIVTYPVRGNHDMDVMNPNKLFPYINAMPHIRRLSQELESPVMALLMHWEGTAPWAPPIVWPPYGGETVFKEFAKALHDEGHLLGVYCSGLGWTVQSNLIQEYNTKEQFEKENLASVMCVSPEGDLPYSNICSVQRSGYDMCPSQDFTVTTVLEQVEKMIGGDIDYIQVLDQNHGGTPYFCYSENHGHPPAPGRWQSEAMVRLLKKLNKAAHEKKVLFGCESAAAETYIPYLLFNDNRYNLNYGVGEAVPVYAYIYHKYINNFMGNQVLANGIFDHTRSPENMIFRFAYAFNAGDMLTLVINQNGEIVWNWGAPDFDSLPNQENIIKFVKNCNAWRRGNGKKYLHVGKMLKPYPVNSGMKHRIHLISGDIFETDRLLTSRWLAPDGKTGQFVVNYNEGDVDFYLETGNGKITVYTDPNDKEGRQYTVTGGITITVRGLSSIMLEKN